MSFAGLKAEVDRLSADDRHQLRAYLALKDQLPEEDFIRSLSEKINDRDPARWLTIEEFEKLVEN